MCNHDNEELQYQLDQAREEITAAFCKLELATEKFNLLTTKYDNLNTKLGAILDCVREMLLDVGVDDFDPGFIEEMISYGMKPFVRDRRVQMEGDVQFNILVKNTVLSDDELADYLGDAIDAVLSDAMFRLSVELDEDPQAKVECDADSTIRNVSVGDL